MPFDSGTIGNVVIGAVITAVLSYFAPLLRDTYFAYTDICGLDNCLENGIRHTIVFPNITLINRPELEKDLERMLTPYTPGQISSYFLITGEHGTGKTTAITKTCVNIGGGVIYVDVPSTTAKFYDAFAAATCYRPTSANNKPSINTWETVFDQFKETAKWYKVEHNKVPVLVIDNVNYLAIGAPEILEILQRDAKSAVDKEEFVIIFVASDGMAIQLLQSKSAFSRGESYRIGDISEKQVVEYLEKQQLIKDMKSMTDEEKTLSSSIFDLVGGRLQLLKMVSNKLKLGTPFEDVKKALFAEVQNRIEQCWRTPEDKNIVQAIFECSDVNSICSVSDVELHLKMAGTPVNLEKIQPIVDNMSSVNLLSKVSEKKWTFHSNVEKSYFKEHPQVTVML